MSSWLTTAIQTVRDKSVDALDFVRKDLTEFTTTVKNDTEIYINKIKTQEVGDLGINRFVSKLNDTVKTDNNDGKHIHASASFDRVHNELARFQNDESTYLIDPTPIEAYESWRESTDFNVDTRKGDIAQLLIDAPHVRSFYARLVPAQTTHSDFWSRYYYRLHQIEEEEARRTQLLRRAHEICSEKNDNLEKNNANDWDEPEEDWSPQSSNINQKSTLETIPDQQENTVVEEPHTERIQSDTVSGDSWEGEFDETNTVSSSIPLKSDVDEPSPPSEETIAPENVPSTTVAEAAPPPSPPLPSSSSEKKGDREFDDEWEAWS